MQRACESSRRFAILSDFIIVFSFLYGTRTERRTSSGLRSWFKINSEAGTIRSPFCEIILQDEFVPTNIGQRSDKASAATNEPPIVPTFLIL